MNVADWPMFIKKSRANLRRAIEIISLRPQMGMRMGMGALSRVDQTVARIPAPSYRPSKHVTHSGHVLFLTNIDCRYLLSREWKSMNVMSKTIERKCNMYVRWTPRCEVLASAGQTRKFQFSAYYRQNIWSYKYSYDTIRGYHCVSAIESRSRSDGE